jgi:hypothetical protein
MRQSRVTSLVETVANVVVGLILAVATQLVVFPFTCMVAIVRTRVRREGLGRVGERNTRR